MTEIISNMQIARAPGPCRLMGPQEFNESQFKFISFGCFTRFVISFSPRSMPASFSIFCIAFYIFVVGTVKRLQIRYIGRLTVARYERRYKISKIGWFRVVRNHSRSLEIALFDRAHTRSIVFHSNYVPILHRFWDILKCWSKIAN